LLSFVGSLTGEGGINMTTVIVHARNYKAAGSVLEDMYGDDLLAFDLVSEHESKLGLEQVYEFNVEVSE
jgi:hypothetical protein